MLPQTEIVNKSISITLQDLHDFNRTVSSHLHSSYYLSFTIYRHKYSSTSDTGVWRYSGKEGNKSKKTQKNDKEKRNKVSCMTVFIMLISLPGRRNCTTGSNTTRGCTRAMHICRQSPSTDWAREKNRGSLFSSLVKLSVCTSRFLLHAGWFEITLCIYRWI